MESRCANAAGVSFPHEHLPRLRSLVARLGIVRAAIALNVGREAIVRAVAGLGLRRATIERIVEGLVESKTSGGVEAKNASRPGLRKSGQQQ